MEKVQNVGIKSAFTPIKNAYAKINKYKNNAMQESMILKTNKKSSMKVLLQIERIKAKDKQKDNYV